MADSYEPLITGLDIGSSAIKVLVAEQGQNGMLRHVASSIVESAGVQSGVIVNISAAARAIEHACYSVEERLGQHLPCVCVNVGGPQVYGVNARGGCSIVPTQREITQQDITRAITTTRHNLSLDRRYEVVYEIPRAYLVNGQIGMSDPRGMIGEELELEIHYTVAPSTLVQTLLKSLHLAHIMPAQIQPGALCSGEALAHTFDAALRQTASEDPCLGVLNIGAETSSVTLYVSGSVWMSQVVPVGGATITQAIARTLRIPYAVAEELKIRYGHAAPEKVDEFELVALPTSAGYNGWMPRRELANSVQQGVYSLAGALGSVFDEAREVMVKPDVVLLTGGCSELTGLEDTLSQALNIPLRRALQGGIVGLPPQVRQPAFVTAAGLILWQHHSSGEAPGANQYRQRTAAGGWLGSVKRAVAGILP